MLRTHPEESGVLRRATEWVTSHPNKKGWEARILVTLPLLNLCKSAAVFGSVLSLSSVASVRPLLATLLVLLVSTPALATRVDLARARSLYNQRQFDAAIEAALVAQTTPATQDAATVVLALAHLCLLYTSPSPRD